MPRYEIVQRLMAVSAQYDVKANGEAEPSMLVKGELMTATPNLQLSDPRSGKLLATLKGNVLKTKFQVRGPANEELATVNFSAIAFRKTLTMSVNGKGYHANAGVVGVVKDVFECKDNDGKIAVVVQKEPGIRDRFLVDLREEREVPPEVAVLAAIAIHSRFYE